MLERGPRQVLLGPKSHSGKADIQAVFPKARAAVPARQASSGEAWQSREQFLVWRPDSRPDASYPVLAVR